MNGSSSFAFSFGYIPFLLVPGYIALRGYLNATIQLDTMSRLDKLLTTVVAGSVTLVFMLVLNRFGVLVAIAELEAPALQYSTEHAVTPERVPRFSALALLWFITAQSVVGYVGGYLLGTFVHVKSSRPQRSDEDLQQPWETAVRQSAIGDTVTVITKNGEEITGTLYRIGSPSKDYDLLLSAAKKVEEDDTIPLGMTYHHYEDISQVRFPEIVPEEPSDEGNWLVRQWAEIQHRTRKAKGKYLDRFSQERFRNAVENGRKLDSYLGSRERD